MAQTKLEGFGAMPGKRHGATGPTYVSSVRAGAKHNSDWMNNQAVRERVAAGARKGSQVRLLRLEALAQQRDAVIVRLIRLASPPQTQRQVYVRYLAEAADHRWTIVTYRMFTNYVRRLVRLGKVKGTCVSIGKGGRFTILRVVPEEVRIA